MRFNTVLGVALIGCISSLAAADDQPADPAQPGQQIQDVVINGDLVLNIETPHEKGAYLGLATSPPAEPLRQQLKLSRGAGLMIDFVEAHSPAGEAGLKQFDVLTKLDEQILIDPHQLAVLVRMHKPGDEVTLTVIREGKTETLKAKLIEHDLPPLEMMGWPEREMFEGAVAPRPGNGPGQHRDGQPGPQFQLRFGPANRALSTTTWSDGETTLTVTSTPDSKEKKLVATDRSGSVLFNGPIDTPEQRAKLPTIVADKLKKLEAATNVPPMKETAPQQEKQNDSGKDAKEPAEQSS